MVCGSMCAYNLYFFIYLVCKEQHITQQIQVHLPSFANRKGRWPNISLAGKQHLPFFVLVLKCALHTLGFISATPQNTRINIELLTPNINKWFLQLNKD